MEKLESYSNLAYFISGVIGFLISGNVLFLLLMTNMGVGSFIYHKYLTGKIFKIDWFAIVILNLGLAGALIDVSWVWVAIASYLAFYGFYLIGRVNVYVEVFLSCVPLIYALYANKTWEIASAILAVFVVGLLVRKIDDHKNKRDVYHDSIPHTLWHFITAIGYLLIVL